MRTYTIRTDRDAGGAGGMLLRLIANATGLFLAAQLIPGIVVDDWQSLVAGTAILAIVNTLVRPLAVLVSCCLVVFTFGLFLVVVNALMLALTAWVAGQLELEMSIDTFWSALGGALIISFVSLLASVLTGRFRAGWSSR